ncbi:MAG: CHAD domain-containing protein [bacterium]|nr:CHAD domain-containing protein [bacterium]MDE0288078.1 CHAD domain-containing protein [bacterium]MDE0377186.1 CHAD domain-containing protein [bacterium]
MVSRLGSVPEPPGDGTPEEDAPSPLEAAHSEIEAKFLIEDAAHVEDLIDSLDSYDVQSALTVDIVDDYWDTPGWHLFRAGWAYRWRDRSGDKSMTLKSNKLRDGIVQKREEVERRVTAFPQDGSHPLVAEHVADRSGGLRSGDLRKLFRVRTHRRLFDIRLPDGALVELGIDRTTITTDGPVKKPAPGRMAFVELEIELKEGGEESLRQLAAETQQRFGLLAARLSKFERGLQTAGLSPPRAPGTVLLASTQFVLALRERKPAPSDPAIHLAYGRLLEQFEEMIAQEPRAWEGLDPEGVHKMRVATRRLRSALRAFKKVLPASIRSFNGEFKWLAATLGGVRDLDVAMGNLPGFLSEIAPEDAAHLDDYQQYLADRWQEERRRLLTCLTSRRYGRLKADFAQSLERGPSARTMEALGSVTVGDGAQLLIGKRYRGVVRRGRAITSASRDESLHALRIRCKQLRYLLEFFRPAYGGLLKAETRRLKKLQDVLGEFQDACVAGQFLRRYAEGLPMRSSNRGQLIALGQLIGGQNRQAAMRRADFAQAWERFDSTGGRKGLVARLAESGADVTANEPRD